MVIIEREASELLRRLAAGFPVLGITGPRQSGKTTLARAAFPGHAYCSLEDPDRLDFARVDPRAFLAQFSGGVILDEVQRCPQLFSYLQGIVDNQTSMGRWVLTGSQQFGFRQQATQTLAGRIGFATLLPLSMRELGPRVNDLNHLMRTGGYPALYSREVASNDWLFKLCTNLRGARRSPTAQRQRSCHFPNIFAALCRPQDSSLIFAIWAMTQEYLTIRRKNGSPCSKPVSS